MNRRLARASVYLAMVVALPGLPSAPASAAPPETVAASTHPAGSGTSPGSGFRTGPPVCTTDAFTTTPLGQVYRWCPGTPTAGGGCSVATMCKRCEANGSWGPDYRC